MPLPSLFRSRESARPWSLAHAAGYGAVLGALAAVFRTLGPLRTADGNLTDRLAEIAIAALAFALLCTGAAMLRNFIARHLIWQDGR